MIICLKIVTNMIEVPESRQYQVWITQDLWFKFNLGYFVLSLFSVLSVRMGYIHDFQLFYLLPAATCGNCLKWGMVGINVAYASVRTGYWYHMYCHYSTFQALVSWHKFQYPLHVICCIFLLIRKHYFIHLLRVTVCELAWVIHKMKSRMTSLRFLAMTHIFLFTTLLKLVLGHT
jgi:hypothetical protein